MKLTRDKLSALLGFKGQDKAIGSEKKPTHASESQMDLGEKEQTDSIQPTDIEQANEQADISDSAQLVSEIESASDETEVETQESGMEYEDTIVVNYTKEQLAQSEAKLAEFMSACIGAYGALISTVDGHEIAYSLKRDLPTHKISTMNSSLLALGESIARESLQQLCQFVILENSDGRVVSLRVNDILMLTCISSKSTNLGMLLSAGRNTADSLAKILP
jgi:predicted regulator of Ras-like GTPase activity (Roadblock/LC7/MglB family)